MSQLSALNRIAASALLAISIFANQTPTASGLLLKTATGAHDKLQQKKQEQMELLGKIESNYTKLIEEVHWLLEHKKEVESLYEPEPTVASGDEEKTDTKKSSSLLAYVRTFVPLSSWNSISKGRVAADSLESNTNALVKLVKEAPVASSENFVAEIDELLGSIQASLRQLGSSDNKKLSEKKLAIDCVQKLGTAKKSLSDVKRFQAARVFLSAALKDVIPKIASWPKDPTQGSDIVAKSVEKILAGFKTKVGAAEGADEEISVKPTDENTKSQETATIFVKDHLVPSITHIVKEVVVADITERYLHSKLSVRGAEAKADADADKKIFADEDENVMALYSVTTEKCNEYFIATPLDELLAHSWVGTLSYTSSLTETFSHEFSEIRALKKKLEIQSTFSIMSPRLTPEQKNTVFEKTAVKLYTRFAAVVSQRTFVNDFTDEITSVVAGFTAAVEKTAGIKRNNVEHYITGRHQDDMKTSGPHGGPVKLSLPTTAPVATFIEKNGTNGALTWRRVGEANPPQQPRGAPSLYSSSFTYHKTCRSAPKSVQVQNSATLTADFFDLTVDPASVWTHNLYKYADGTFVRRFVVNDNEVLWSAPLSGGRTYEPVEYTSEQVFQNNVLHVTECF